MKLFYLVTFVWLFLDTLTINAQSGLVAHWSFDELTNNIIYDNSSNANHGTNYGASLVPGIVGNALSFDGKNDFVRIP